MYINYLAQAMRMYSRIITIPPAFYENINVYEKGGYHQACLITLGDKRYIIDITYSQFLLMRENNFNRIGIPLLGGCNVGAYMTLTKERRDFAENLMKNGCFLATEENLKLYFDGFALSYRNGLYYENFGKIDYTTKYEASDYLNFINQIDSQVNHESFHFLGRQKRLLKNPYLNFANKKNDENTR